MRTIARRLQRLEERCGPLVESAATKRLRVRLEAARVKLGSPPVSSKHLEGSRVMSIVEILKAGRQRVALAQKERPKTAREFDNEPVDEREETRKEERKEILIRSRSWRLERLEARVRLARHAFSIRIHFVDPEKVVTSTLLLQSGKRIGQGTRGTQRKPSGYPGQRATIARIKYCSSSTIARLPLCARWLNAALSRAWRHGPCHQLFRPYGQNRTTRHY